MGFSRGQWSPTPIPSRSSWSHSLMLGGESPSMPQPPHAMVKANDITTTQGLWFPLGSLLGWTLCGSGWHMMYDGIRYDVWCQNIWWHMSLVRFTQSRVTARRVLWLCQVTSLPQCQWLVRVSSWTLWHPGGLCLPLNSPVNLALLFKMKSVNPCPQQLVVTGPDAWNTS